MNKAELNILAQKYLAGTATPEEKRLLDDWYGSVRSGETAIVDLNEPATEDEIKQRIFNNLNQKLFAQPKAQVKAKGAMVKRMLVWASSAAAVLALTFFAWQFYNKNNADTSLADKQIVNVPYNRVMHLTLPDSSKVWLNAGSVFRYPKVFSAKNRTVELVEGRAFFDVKHEIGHPFIVKTKNLNVTVLGTSFDVRSYKKEGTTRVAVVTGRVGITMPNAVNKKAIFLLPSQQIVLSNVTKVATTGVVNDVKVTEWTKNNFVFEQESLANVFKLLEKEYKTTIVVNDQELLNKRIHITINNQHLDTIMQILSYTNHFKYQMANDSTVIVK